jgi:ubiquinone/menaquinone biosynthesis C-methylase UbiE
MNISGSEKILDVGGECYFWKPLEFIKDVTLLNLHKAEESERIKSVVYDGGRLPFEDKSFDIVFSNSTIEHVGDFKQQKLFANEIERVAKRHFVQTPSYWFVYEPHAQIPFFQFLTDNLKKKVGRYFNKSTYSIEELLTIRLLKKSQIRILFPQSIIVTERFLSLPKSYYIIKP